MTLGRNPGTPRQEREGGSGSGEVGVCRKPGPQGASAARPRRTRDEDGGLTDVGRARCGYFAAPAVRLGQRGRHRHRARNRADTVLRAEHVECFLDPVDEDYT